MANNRKFIIIILAMLFFATSIVIIHLYLQRPRFTVISGESVIVFSRRDELGHQLYAVTANGSRLARITKNIERIAWWLPLPNPFGSVTTNVHPLNVNGTNDIVFTSTLGQQDEEGLYRIGIDGLHLRRVINPAGQRITGYPSPDLNWTAQIHADGTLHVVSINKSQDRCLTCTISKRVSSPSWSRDSRQITFSTSQGVYSVDIDGANLRRLTPLGLEAIEPAWSFDGTRIAFASKVSSHYRIFIVNSDGTELRQLTRDPEAYTNPITDDRQPAWSPDGSQIAFVSTRDGSSEIYTVGIDGTQMQRVTTIGNVLDPTWLKVQ